MIKKINLKKSKCVKKQYKKNIYNGNIDKKKCLKEKKWEKDASVTKKKET